MRTITTMIFFAAISLTPAIAAYFLDIPATNAWTKVRDGETTQWSIIPSARPNTRIDLISYHQGKNRINYYIIRSACPNGEVAKYLIKPGKQVGLGIDCNGNVVSSTSTVIGEAPKLPAEAEALLKR